MTDPDRYEQLQPEIMSAYADGRVKWTINQFRNYWSILCL
jgi:hypothetical protein